jgi:chromosomal replication initiator protein
MTCSIGFDAVVEAVARHFAISKEQVRGGGRYRRQRRIAYYLAKRLTRRSLPEIGRQIGGVSHTAVVVGIRIIQGAMTDDAVFAAEIELLCDQLTAGGS